MNKIIILSILTSLLSQTPIKSQSKLPETKADISISFEKIESIEKRLNTLEKSDLKNLNQRLDIAKEVIATHDTMFSGISTIFSLFSAILTILAIALPFLTYFFGIKPAQDSIKNLRIEIANFLQNNQKELMENAIQNLKSPNLQIKNDASLYLSLNQHYAFSEKDNFEIYSLLRSDLEESHKYVLKLLLSNKISTYANNYFDELLLSDEADKNIYFIMRYYSICGIESKIDRISSYLKKVQRQPNAGLTLFSQIISYSQSDFLKLIECDEIISAFEIDTRKKFLEYIQGTIEYNKLTEKFYSSKLYNTFSE